MDDSHFLENQNMNLDIRNVVIQNLNIWNMDIRNLYSWNMDMLLN
jgi:hypothetical protein